MSPAVLEAAKAALEQIHEIHKAFGAPGDYGYSTKEGKALFGLYRAGNDLQSALNKSSSTDA